MKTNIRSLWFRNSKIVVSLDQHLLIGLRWREHKCLLWHSPLSKKQPTLRWTQFIPRGVIFNANFANTLILFQDISSCTNRNGWDHVKLISPFKLSLFTFILEQSNKHWKQLKNWGSLTPKYLPWKDCQLFQLPQPREIYRFCSHWVWFGRFSINYSNHLSLDAA